MNHSLWTGTHYTHPGKVRTINEDSVLNLNSESLWAVADGMGGHSAGDFASQLLVQELGKYHYNSARGIAIAQIESFLKLCNSELVKKAARENSGIIGSTIAALSLHGPHVVTTWCGDSRVYRLRSGELSQLTRDHSYQSMSQDRDQNYFPDEFIGDGQLLTSAIGGGEDICIEHCWFDLQYTDRFLICTDGLYKEVPDIDISEAMLGVKEPESILADLSHTYFDRGARDNIGMIFVSANVTSS